MNLVLHAFPDEAGPARRLAAALQVPVAFVEIHQFPDGEIVPHVPPAARTTIVYRSLNRPNPKLVELLLAQDAWWRAGARRLILVAPYLCYMRQDHVDRPGAPNSQEAVGAFLSKRFDRIVTVDPHLHRNPDIEAVLPGGQASCISASRAAAAWLADQPLDAVLVGPDAEARQWVEPLARPDGRAWLTLSKQRNGDRAVEITADGIDVADKPVILVDDVCSTGETLIAAAAVLKAAGAGPIKAFVTHALFDEATQGRMHAAGLEAIVSTDSVLHPTNTVHLAGLLADALGDEVAP